MRNLKSQMIGACQAFIRSVGIGWGDGRRHAVAKSCMVVCIDIHNFANARYE
jgi:hypothetical protein